MPQYHKGYHIRIHQIEVINIICLLKKCAQLYYFLRREFLPLVKHGSAEILIILEIYDDIILYSQIISAVFSHLNDRSLVAASVRVNYCQAAKQW